MEYLAGSYDVIVIGAGHAGIEACLASARLGCKTAVFTINLDWVGNMPCNPSIGGTSKGHLVREIDALGGEMGKMADKYTLQSRMLNLGKGPAVHSLRAQIDRREYSQGMKHTLELEDNLDIRQGEIVDLYRLPDGNWQVKTKLEALFNAKAVIIATGTFLGGRVYIGDVSYESGPDGMFPATELSKALKKLDIPLRRFKTGTPSRVNRKSIDFTNLEEQDGDEETVPFSFETEEAPKNKVCCHITYSNEKTKQIILDNLDRSPMYSGKIEGKGPRYCPSFEDKIVRFKDKERHQLFIEPCGLETEEMYLQGLSSSLPEDVQLAFIHTIPGLEHAQVMRTAYAIEYDCVDPTALNATLEFNSIAGLYGAGQFNGSSGYEEAAAQGLVAGINAALKIKGEEPLILDRGGSYIGTLIDDLVTKGCTDPYRMMTSRSEYRLVLRQDNADVRLTPIGYKIGLISQERYDALLEKERLVATEIDRVQHVTMGPSAPVLALLEKYGTAPIKNGARLSDLLKRPQLSYEALAEIDPERPDLPQDVQEQVNIRIKYAGYIDQQLKQVEQFKKLEGRLLPMELDYETIQGLRLEARQKLNLVRPENLGQASRITGVSPADISVLLIYMEQMKRKH